MLELRIASSETEQLLGHGLIRSMTRYSHLARDVVKGGGS